MIDDELNNIMNFNVKAKQCFLYGDSDMAWAVFNKDPLFNENISKEQWLAFLQGEIDRGPKSLFVPHFNEQLNRALDCETAYSFLPYGDFMAGGCALLALALNLAYPSTFPIVGVYEGHRLEHVCVSYQDMYCDRHGFSYEEEVLTRLVDESPHLAINRLTLRKIENTNDLNPIVDPSWDIDGFSRYLLSFVNKAWLLY